MSPHVQPEVVHSILLVDDEPGVCEVLGQTLEHERYAVTTFTDPHRALEELRRREFSVVLSDLRMPGLSGLELLAEAKRLHPHTTRILITAVLSLDTVVDAVNKGEIFRFIVKPWLQAELLTTVQNGVQRYELLRQNAALCASTQAMNEKLVEMNRSLAQQVGLVASQNQQLASMNARLEATLLRSLELCVHTLRTYYPALGEQIRRVAQLCRAMADVLDLSKQDRRTLESSALLYDIGLVGVPRHIIRKWQEDPDSLNYGERALVGQHPILGQELAALGNEMNEVGEIIRAHHECYDGSGYPDQLLGDNIPWLARLLAVAVTFASSRLALADSRHRVELAAGSALDPEAVRVFLRALKRLESSHEGSLHHFANPASGMARIRDVYVQHRGLVNPM